MERPGIFRVRRQVPESVARLGAGLRTAGESLLAAVGRHPRVAGLLAPALQAERDAHRHAEVELDRLTEELAAAREREERAGAARVEADRAVAALRAELDEARARAQAAARDAEERNQQLAAVNQALRAELADAASGEAASPSSGNGTPVGDSAGERDDVEAALRHQVDALRRKERELLVKANLLSQRVRELRSYADENAALRSRLVDFDAALARAGALQRRVKELEARDFAAEATAPTAAPASPPVSAGASVGATLDDNLAAVLRAFGARVAVVADANGLLLGGAGDRSLQENLAAVAGFVLETAERAAEFLPLGSPHRVELQYAGGIQLSTRMFICDGEAMALTLLQPGELTLDKPIEGAVAAIVQLIAATG